ncbi:MAG: LysR family transcriptional regulator [Rhodospirillales bacterium]|nr:LysR family transcriptional regulator [Rhodospirillales bacterium]
MNLHNVDLNLLKVLHALIEERNVTRAGERIGRSQPAMSNALNRLRAMFDDPLLVRGKGGLQLTPRAESLKDPVNTILGSIEDCLVAETDFDPASAQGLYRLASPDFISLQILPPLMARISKAAPGLELHLITEDRKLALEALDSKRADLVLGTFENFKSSIRVKQVFEEEFVCLVRKGHPIVKQKMTLETLLSYRHLLVSATGSRKAIFDSILDDMNCKRQVAISVSHFLHVPYLLENSDLTGVFFRGVSETLLKAFKLEICEIPFDASIFNVSLAWHLRSDRDPALSWIREQVEDVCQELRSAKMQM